MKKYLSLMVIAGLMLSFSFASVAKAIGISAEGHTSVSTTPTSNTGQMQNNRQAFLQKLQAQRKEFMSTLQANRAAFVAEVKAKRGEWATATPEQKAQVCETANDIVTNRFQIAVSQLETYRTDVKVVIDKLHAEGKDTTAATASLTLSQQKLEDAKTKLVSMHNGASLTDCQNVTVDELAKVKTGAGDAKALLLEAREALHEAIQDVRDLIGDQQ